MWVQFLRPFDYVPPSRRGKVMLAYRHDGPERGRFSVVRKCGEDAIAAGAAVAIETPKRGPDADEAASAE